MSWSSARRFSHHISRHIAISSLVAGLFLAGCATNTDVDDIGGGNQIDSGGEGLDGSWFLVSAIDSDGPVGIDELKLDIDTEFAVVKTDDICQRAFGSLSFTSAGDVTFTIPGSTTGPCDDDLEAEHLRFVAALETITSWDSTAPGLILAGPDQVRLEFRPAG